MTDILQGCTVNAVRANLIHPRMSFPAAATSVARAERERATLENIGGTSALIHIDDLDHISVKM